MLPIQRKFQMPPGPSRRFNLAVNLPQRPDSVLFNQHLVAECEVEELEAEFGQLVWEDSVNDYERAFQDTCPAPL